MNKKTIIYSIKSALPVMTGYIVLSIGFGLLLQGELPRLNTSYLKS